MRRVLFVDDEQSVLDGLRRMLYDMSSRWRMEFVTSAGAGLRLMETEPFDVVVSDMRMPAMDGADFLGEVRKKYPKTARIILSGQSDEASVLRSLGATHQYLAKPCDPALLRRTIDRLCALQDLLESDRVRDFVAGIETLPSVPSLYQEISALAQDPKVTLEALGTVIERDVAMSATVVKLVNSAYFGMVRPVESVTRAVMFLGLDTIRALVLGTSVFQAHRGIDPALLSVEKLWDHSVRASAFARCVAKGEHATPDVVGQASLAAMFHDVGKLILATHDATKYREVRDRVAREKQRLSAVELEVYRATHAEIGAYLLGLWGFPEAVVRAVAFHSRPADAFDDRSGATTWVHVADALARAGGGPEDLASSYVDMKFLEANGWAEKLPAWAKRCAELMPAPATK